MSHRDEQAMVAALIAILEDWARWQGCYSMNLGYPSKSAGISSGGLQTFDDMCDQCDNAMMQAVDACVSDLQTIQQAAIMKRYGIAAVFRFNRVAYEDVLLSAHLSLMSAFKRKSIAPF